ncbi:sugar phosphate isomerase/epimerase [Actinocrinis puniceicyclus]|uniref:Sugar phosphate isomerase/epimerase n=1 Tax=Actinocrinis puniceicyclus TaxID=977794 RepID=A0A8J7WRG5_9ACTN|nr:sugar phosphate isomerase/epimerase [Actinocrinis puniceicyclus]MBS2966153.1 sugar phosphate isomerase/epimerase [Actinocrinis puniceicyclus]
MTNPISVQLYSVREHMAADRDATLRRVAGLGYRAVEPYNPADDPKGFRALADELGLTVSGTHAGGLVREPEPGPTFEAVARLGTELAIVPAGIPEQEFTTLDGIARAADLLNGLAEQASGYGLKLAYHNHWWEFEPRIDGVHALEVLAQRLSPRVFLEIDTYWAAVAGAQVPELLERLGERVVALHVKDGPMVKGEPNTAVGTGAMPVRAILDARPDAWRVVEFDSCAGDVFEALAASHAYLTAVRDGRGGPA